MKAVVIGGDGRPTVAHVPEPEPPIGDEALVKVEVAGICGTDLHVLRGDHGGVPEGTVLGHEFVGLVVDTGPNVVEIGVGDRVFSSDFSACGRCRWCGRSQHWHCEQRRFFGTGQLFGSAVQGAQAEYVLVPHADTTLARLTRDCPSDAAILMADNLATAWSAVDRASLEAGEVVVVIGGGPVGMLSAHCALAVGAGSVIVVEPAAARRAVAESQGAIAVSPDGAAKLVGEATSGDGADVVIEAVGVNATLDTGVELVRRGGRLISVGAHGAETWNLPVARSFSDELNLSFVIGNAIATRDRLQRMVIGGALDPTFVIDGRVAIDDAPAAYQALIEQNRLKIVIDRW